MKWLKEKITIIRESKYQQHLLVLFHLGFVISLLVKIFYFQYTSRFNQTPFNQELNNRMLWATFFSILMVYGITLLISFKQTKYPLIVVNVIISLILFADTLYARYYSSPLGINVIIHQFTYIGDVQSSTMSLLKFKDIIYFIDWPLWIIGAILLSKPKVSCWRRRVGISLIILGISYMGFNNVYQKVNSAMFYFERRYIVRDVGILYYHYHDIKSYINSELNRNKEPLSDEEMDFLQRQFYVQKPNDFTGIAEGMNLLIIQLEAMQGFVINQSIEGQAITPNLNELLKDSFYFENLYNQVGSGNTSDAEFLTNNSLFGYPTGAAYFLFPNNHYSSLGQNLKKQNYHTMVFHGNDPSFWNREIMFRNQGFDRFYSIDDYDFVPQLNWGVDDKTLFTQSLDYIQETAKGDPFYGFLVTLELHHPYYNFAGAPLDVGKYTGTMLGNFLKGAHEVDKAVGQLMDELKVRGLYDNTLVVIYGDHSALFEDQAANVTEFLGIDYNPFNWQQLQKITALIHVPNYNKGQMIEAPAGNIDLLPTIANLMNLEMPYMLGRDLLGEDEAFVVRRDGSIVTEEFIYLTSTQKVYDIHSGQELPMEEYKERIVRYQEQMRASDLILEKDALRSFIEERR